MKALNKRSLWLVLFLLIISTGNALSQKVNFASDSFVSYVTLGTSTWGMTFCADSASNIYVYDENGILLSTFFLPAPGCIELLYDSAILSNAASGFQFDTNRMMILTDVAGLLYQSSTQNLIASEPLSIAYPSLYDMRLVPPPTMAGTANIQLGYNYECGRSVFPYTFQLYAYNLELIGISDTSRIVVYPGWSHPLNAGQSFYKLDLPFDCAWLEGHQNGTGSPIYPLYYPPTIIDQDSSSFPKGKFITNTGIWGFEVCSPSNPWGYNFRFLFFPLAYEFLGTNYHTIPHATRLGDSLMAFSFHDSTLLNINGSMVTLNKGEIFRTLIDSPAVWTANHPFSLIQISRQSAQDSVFQSALFAYSVHPDEAMLTYTWYPSEIINDTIPAQQSYLNLLSPSNGITSVKLDGVSLASFFQPYNMDTTWSWAQVPVASSLHKLEADSGVIAYAYQYGESCGVGFNVGGLRMKNTITTSLPEWNNDIGFNLYPNPAINVIYLTHVKDVQEELKASVWSMDGRMVLRETSMLPNYRLDISALNPGVYLLKINAVSTKKISTLRFVKIP